MNTKANLVRLLIVSALLIGLFCSHAISATLVWNSSSGVVEGYKVYYGTSGSNPTTSIDVGKVTQYSLDVLPLAENTQYYFRVSAYNNVGESAPCHPVAYTPADTTPPAPPIGLKAE